MRTTVTLPDGLFRQAKALAAQQGRTLGSVVENGLRLELERAERGATMSAAEPLPTFGTGGVATGVDLSDNAALADLLDGVEATRPQRRRVSS